MSGVFVVVAHEWAALQGFWEKSQPWFWCPDWDCLPYSPHEEAGWLVPLIPSSHSLLSNAYNLESHHRHHLICPLFVGECCSHTARNVCGNGWSRVAYMIRVTLGDFLFKVWLFAEHYYIFKLVHMETVSQKRQGKVSEWEWLLCVKPSSKIISLTHFFL